MRLRLTTLLLLLFISFIAGFFVSFVFVEKKQKNRGETAFVVSPPETIFVENEKIVYKTKTKFVEKVDTFKVVDTMYVYGQLTYFSKVERRMLDYFLLVDSIYFTPRGETGILTVDGYLFQKEPVPIFLDIRLKDKGVLYSYSSVKSWNGRFDIYATYQDERNPFQFFAGGGVRLGNALYLSVSSLYKQKYLATLSIDSKGQIGLGLKINITDFVYGKNSR